MTTPIYQEYLEGEDPEHDIEELNILANKKNQAFAKTTTFIRTKNPDLETKYEDIIKKYEDHFKEKDQDKDNYNKEYDEKLITKKEPENPVLTFTKLQKEVELIEKDLEYYSKNKDSYKSIAPLETSLEELNKLKYIISYINSSKNLEKLKKIQEIQKKNRLKLEEDKFNLLNKKIYTNLDEQLTQRLNKIKKLKTENPINYKNIEYELFLTPDNEKMKQLKELDEIVIKINEIENKIGKWNFNNKKNTIASNLDTIKKNMILMDKMAKIEMKKKFDNAKEKINDIKDNYKEAYAEMDVEKLKNLTSDGIDAKNAEKIICNVIYKMELLKDEHEKSIYLSQKVKELISKNENIKGQIEENIKILDGLQESVQNNVDTMSKNIKVIIQKLK